LSDIHHIYWSWQKAFVIGPLAIFKDKVRGGVVFVWGGFHNETRHPTGSILPDKDEP
jgi:hypothetical protein